MRKLYAFLGGLIICLAGLTLNAQTNPDSCSADFEKLNTSANPLQATFRALPWHSDNRRPVYICWLFGDGSDTCIQYSNTNPGPYTVNHTYRVAGEYRVCVRIIYAGGCEASKCREIRIGRPDSCRADFEKAPTTFNNPLRVYYRALPWHNNNKKPQRICWRFGDGRDTCINYPANYTGRYVVSHTYRHPGLYEVCVSILYYGGCEARKCKPIRIGRTDSCRADFEKITSTVNNPLRVHYRALPWHNNNKKPQRICWRFGDGRDTCINYPANYTGRYVVSHTYRHPGLYEVCVSILYYGGCEARKCKTVRIGERPDTCRADFEKLPTVLNNPLRAHFRALPWHNNNKKPQRICWRFGDGRDTCITYTNSYTGPYTVSHRYQQPGLYEVCVSIQYFGGCEARKCKPIRIGERPDTCRADFEKLQSTFNNPLRVHYRALPWHNNNKKPQRICWRFGDGTDTCITYTNSYTGPYTVSHTYQQPGNYEVCVSILYFGGCEARKCKLVRVGHPDECTADFERIFSTTNTHTVFRALPWNNHNRKPQRICWDFGDGSDTCINYPENYTGPYTVTHRYDHPGTYEVCVRILYYGGCEARKCKPVVIPPVGDCSVNLVEIIPNVNSFTRGFFASISSNPVRRPVRICWYFGDGDDTCINIPSTVANFLPYLFIRHTYPGPGLYRACVVVRFLGGCEARDCDEVFIRSHTSVCGGFMMDSLTGPRSYLFKAFGIQNRNDEVVNYFWTFGDGSSATGREVRHVYNQPGEYEVCLRMRTRMGCETRICKPLRVPANHNSVLQLSPNPVINILNVSFYSTHTEAVNIRILNGNGTMVRNFTRNVTAGANNWTHDLTNLIPGAYSYVVQSPNQLASAIFLKL